MPSGRPTYPGLFGGRSASRLDLPKAFEPPRRRHLPPVADEDLTPRPRQSRGRATDKNKMIIVGIGGLCR